MTEPAAGFVETAEAALPASRWAERQPSVRASHRFEKVLTVAELLIDLLMIAAVLYVFLPILLPIAAAKSSGHILPLAIVAASSVLFVLMLDRSGAYRADISLLQVRETERVLRSSVETMVLAALFAVAFARNDRLVLPVALLALIVTAAVIAEKQIVYVVVRWLHVIGVGVRRVVIFGAGQTGQRVFSVLARSPKLGLDPVAILDESPRRAGTKIFERGYRRERSIEVMHGSLTRHWLREHRADVVLIGIPSLPRAKFLTILQEATAAGVSVAFVPATHLSSEFWIEHADIDGLLIASIGRPGESLVYKLIKRLFDLVVSTAMLVIVAPVWAALAIAIRLDSPGPVLFVQRRVGHNGKVFNMYKFRTMRTDAPAYAYSPTASSDPRITHLGRMLRRTSIDELPQLLNVLRGDMSLVGPRPEMPFIVEQYSERERQRLHVKPGVTGLWQISADREFKIHENLEYDLYYLRNRNFFMDLAILLHTALFAMRGI